MIRDPGMKCDDRYEMRRFSIRLVSGRGIDTGISSGHGLPRLQLSRHGCRVVQPRVRRALRRGVDSDSSASDALGTCSRDAMKVEIIEVEYLDEYRLEGEVRFRVEGIDYIARCYDCGFECWDAAEVEFDHVPGANATADVVNGNVNKDRRLEQVGRLTYVGYGEVVAVDPTVVDFGPLSLRVPLPDAGIGLGSFVRWEIGLLTAEPSGIAPITR